MANSNRYFKYRYSDGNTIAITSHAINMSEKIPKVWIYNVKQRVVFYYPNQSLDYLNWDFVSMLTEKELLVELL